MTKFKYYKQLLKFILYLYVKKFKDIYRLQERENLSALRITVNTVQRKIVKLVAARKKPTTSAKW